MVGGDFQQLLDEVLTLQDSIAQVDATLCSTRIAIRVSGKMSMIRCCFARPPTIEALNRHMQDVDTAASVRDGRVKARPLLSMQAVQPAARADQIARFHSEIGSHRLAMQIILQALTVYMNSSGVDVDVKVLTVDLHKLLDLIATSHRNTSTQHAGAQSILDAHRRLQASAKAVASDASVVLWWRSLEWPGSQPPHSGITSLEVRSSLNSEARRRISSWVVCNPERDSSIPEVPMHPLPLCSKRITSSANILDRVDEMGIIMSCPNEDVIEDELELDIAWRYLDEARHSAGQRDYAKAETYYRKCLQRAVRLGKTWNGLPIEDMKLEIAVACYEQDKLSDALRLIDALARRVVEDDVDRKRMVTAWHLKALTLLRRGSMSSALRQCKHTMAHQRRLSGGNAAYYESIALVATIYDLQGDEMDAQTYTTLLPTNFARPNFKPPMVPIRPMNMAPAKSIERYSTMCKDMVRELTRCFDEQAGPVSPSSPFNDQAGGNGNIASPRTNTSSVYTASPSNSSIPSHNSGSRTSMESETSRYQQRPLPLVPSKTPHTFDSRPQKSGSSMASDRYMEAPSPASRSVDQRLPPRPLAGCKTKTAHLEARSTPPPTHMASESCLGHLQSSRRANAQTMQILSPGCDVVHRPELAARAKSEAHRLLESNAFQLTKARDWQEQYLWAASNGHHDVVHLLLTDWQCHKSSRLGFKSKEMVNHKAVPIDAVDGLGRTALHLAVLHRHTEIVGLLLDCGASFTKRMAAATASSDVTFDASKAGRTALECAIVQDHHASVAVFVRKGCVEDSTDRYGWSLLHYAADKCGQATFDLLLSVAFDPNKRTPTGRTSLHLAARKGRQSIIELLLQHKVEIDAKDSQGDTPMSLAVSCGHLPCVKMLQAAGGNIRTRNSLKASLLHIAAREGHDHLLSYLVFKGADIEGCDGLGRSALHYAATFDRPKALHGLISLGADVSAVDEEGNTGLHASAEAGHGVMVQAMHAQGLSLRQQNRLGRTALHLAAMAGHRRVVMDLITAGADVQQLDRSGLTAASYARAKGHKQVAELLELTRAVG